MFSGGIKETSSIKWVNDLLILKETPLFHAFVSQLFAWRIPWTILYRLVFWPSLLPTARSDFLILLT